MSNNVILGASFLGFSKITSQAYNFIVTIYIANLLDPADYALMGIAVLIIGLLQFIADSGLGATVVQQSTLDREDLDSVFWLTALIGFVLSTVCYFSSHIIESFFDMEGVSAILRVLCIVIIINSISVVPQKLLERELRFRTKALIDVIAKIVSLTLAAVMATIGFGVWSLVYGYIAFLSTGAFLSYLFRPFCPGVPGKSKKIYDMLSYGFNIIGLRFTWYLRNQIDKVVGGKFLTQNTFGLYSFAFQIARNLQDVILSVMNTVSVPVIAKKQNDPESINRSYLKLVKYCSVLSFPLFLGGSLCSKELIKALLQPKWLPASNILAVACIVQIFRLLNAANENIFIAIGKPQYSLFMNVIFGLLFAVSFLIGVRWHLDGLLATWLILMPLLYTVWTIFTLKYLKININQYLKVIKPSCYATIIMFMVVLFLKICFINEFDPRLIVGTKITGIIFFGVISYITIIKLKDPGLIDSILQAIKK